MITTSEVNRPGIVLTGYTDYFDSLRIQILGWTEIGFIRSMEPDEREAALDCWLSLNPAAAVVTEVLKFPIIFTTLAKSTKFRFLDGGGNVAVLSRTD